MAFLICSLLILFFISREQGFIAGADQNKNRFSFTRIQKIFDDGAHSRIVNKSLSEPCSNYESVEKLVCLEGHYYVIRSQELNQAFNALKSSSDKVDTKFEHIADARAAGQALSFLKKTPSRVTSANSDEIMSAYVFEGWGFRETLVRKPNDLAAKCNFQEFNRFCLFGVGRSAFSLGLNLVWIEEMPQSLKDGYLFEMNLSGESSLEEPQSVAAELAANFKNFGKRGYENFSKCVVSGEKHFADCKK